MKFLSQDHAGAHDGKDVAKDKLYRVRVFGTQTNRLGVSMVPLVHMLVEEARVQETMRDPENEFLNDQSELGLP